MQPLPSELRQLILLYLPVLPVIKYQCERGQPNIWYDRMMMRYQAQLKSYPGVRPAQEYLRQISQRSDRYSKKYHPLAVIELEQIKEAVLTQLLSMAASEQGSHYFVPFVEDMGDYRGVRMNRLFNVKGVADGLIKINNYFLRKDIDLLYDLLPGAIANISDADMGTISGWSNFCRQPAAVIADVLIDLFFVSKEGIMAANRYYLA